MRTTVELDDTLVDEARRVLGGPTLRAMIERSLREALRAHRREALRRAIESGSVDLTTLTDDDLHRMRRDKRW